MSTRRKKPSARRRRRASIELDKAVRSIPKEEIDKLAEESGMAPWQAEELLKRLARRRYQP